MQIEFKDKTFTLFQTCFACPEQYDVFCDGEQVGYIRLRWGTLSCDYPDYDGTEVYRYTFDEEYKGCFADGNERDFYLEICVEKLYNIFSKK